MSSTRPPDGSDPGAPGLSAREQPAIAQEDEGLPVVARMVVEIRSDGSRTVARGALEDLSGQRVAVEARGATPWALARELAKALWTMPLPRPSLRAMLPGRRRRRGGDED